ncbi:MAG: PadR family transcriptional regulator [Solobacterium sp.]|nr:PadR family transcriptional regulator [Solobacterium sp.]
MAAVTADMIRGNTDTIILRFLNEKDSYGYEINRQIRSLTDMRYELNEATLYTAFKRLEKAGMITSYWGNEGSGARRRYYSITEEGRKAYVNSVQEWDEAIEMLERLIK